MISRGIGKSAARSVARPLSQFGSGSGGVAPSYDTDAQTYITAVEAADGQSLETGVKDAINAFVVGCKADGVWTAIKASCILAGARTLTGALVPLVGTAPTNNNFVSGDYSRTAGLTGDGATKYLNANRLQDADPQDDFHMSIYSSNGISGITMGSSPFFGSTVPADHIAVGAGASDLRFRSRYNGGGELDFGDRTLAGFYGHSRAVSTGFTARTGGANTSITVSSSVPGSYDTHVFRRPNFSPVYSSSQVAFYSIGESLDLALLDSRVTTLITDIGTALA